MRWSSEAVMYLKELNILNFKNLESASFAFSPNLNCFSGCNGAGKTNILDAVYFLSVGKSAFSLTDRQCVLHGRDFFMIDASFDVSSKGMEHVVCSFSKDKGKVIKRNDKDYKRLSEHVGLLPVVMVSPADVYLINEAADERRRYLNHFMSLTDSEFLGLLVRYNGVLAQRNKLLKQSGGFNPDIVDVLDMQLSDLAAQLFNKRIAAISDLAPVVSHYYRLISDDSEPVELTYSSEMLSGESLYDILKRNIGRDAALGYTSSGIHRDDLVMKIAGYPIRKYGSQGQQKSFIISLKLAQYEMIYRLKGFKPILLLDDIFDKLDGRRVKNLISLVAQHKFGQIFITDSDKVRIDSLLDEITDERKLFAVKYGTVTEGVE